MAKTILFLSIGIILNRLSRKMNKVFHGALGMYMISGEVLVQNAIGAWLIVMKKET